MDQDSFAIVDDVVSFVGPNGPIALTSSSWLDANTLELVFASQSSLGRYELVLSPAIQDLAGIAIDQDADGEPGESVEDRYSATFDLSAGPRVVGHSPAGQVTEPITEIKLTFNEAIEASTFTASDIEIQGPSGAIAITGAPEHVSGNTYRIRFPQQSGYGDYHVFVGPQIQNVGGQEMDQDWDGILGEAVEDRYDATFTIIDVMGPRGTSHSPSLPVQGPLTSVDITFNEAIDAASFDASDVTIAGPTGPIVASQVEQLSADEFRVHFPTQSAEGAYHFTIGPNIQDLAQNWMDQDEDGLKQEPTDQYQAVLMIDDTAPLVTANSLTSVQNTAVRSFEITFTEAIDETSFDPEAITVTGPTGIATATKVDVLDVDRFQISIAGTEADGTYHVSLTPTVTDLAGNLLQEPYEFDFVQQLPDLRVTIGDYPLECVPGQQIEIQWTVTNAGQGAAVGGWTDRVFFSSDDGGNDGVELVQLEFDQLLPPGESYTRVATVTVPAEASGERWVVVTADGLAALDEIDNTNNTTVLQPPLLITERPYPDLRVSELTAPSTLAAGELVKVSWTVQNSGSGATTAGSWFDALYLSSDAALDNSDVKLTKVKNLDFLAAGESYVQSIEVLVPDSTPRGTYFLIAATDTDNAVQEFDREGNNAAASDNAIDVVTPPPAFLTVTSIQVGSTLEPGVRPTFTWTITNTGGTTIDYGWSSGTGWDDALALSRDQVYQEDQDYWLGSHTYWQGLPLAPGESYTSTGTAENRVPAWEPGTYYLVVIPDTHFGAGSAFGQSVINRDYGVAEVQIAYTVPDLAPISITIPENATVGQPLNIGWSVKNAGEGQTRTNNWSDRIYLSTDGILDSEDMPLGTVPHNGTLTAGTNYSASTTFKLPGNLSTGTYHLILKTDDTATVAESDETNNLLVSSSTVTVNRVASDLQVTSAEAPAAGIAGQAITIDWTVLNSGGDPTAASTWTDAIYLSDSASFDPGKARVLKEFSHTGVLASQGTYSRSELVPLPQHMEGTFYLFLAVDSRKELFELDAEENNLQAIGTAIEIVDHQPDLRVASFLVPTTAIADHSIELEWQIENVGSGSGIPNWQDAVYLSKDDILGPEDGNPLVTLTRQAILAPNGTYSPIPSPVSIRLPDGIEGTYHIILATDSGNTLYEKGSEQNNIAIRTIEIEDLAADLQVVSATIPAAGQAGEFIAIDYTAINRGREDAIAPWKDAIYLSEDDHFDPTNDRLIGVLSHSTSVGIDQTYKPQMMPAYVRLPDRVEGVFHIFVDVDHSNSVPEKLGESNNAFLVPQPISIFLTPADLIVSRVQAPINATAGALVTVSWSVKNQGPQSTAESTWSDGVYLSTDTTFDPASDIELGTSAHVGKLMAGESYDVSAQFRVRQDIEGPYYVYVIADARRQVFENQLDENNVTAAPVALSVIGQHADLTVAAVNGPTSAVAGEPVAIGWTVTNTGVDATPGSTWSDSVYLSNDSVLDASDVLIGTFPHNGQLPPNGSYTQSRGITIPAGTMGAYYVIVKTDSSTRNDVFEFQAESNNTSVLNIEVSLAPPADLEVAEINAPISAWSGQDFHIEWTSVNSGGTPANSKEAGWYDSVYLSRDAYLDPTTDLHLGSVLHTGILQPDATYTGSLDVRLPVGLSGPYYVFVFTDSTNRVGERGAEGNNFRLASPTLQINLTPPADLVPTRVAPPSTVIAGEPALWEYDVTNNGTLDAMGAWYDTLYLSADASWDVDDARIARVYHKGDLAHGEHYDQAVTATVPAVLPGEYYLIVRTDILDQVRESAQDETNNAAASVEKVTVSYHELSTGGGPVTGQINAGERRYFEIPDVVADGNLVLNLNVASAEATSELYIRYGEPPTRSLYDVTAKDRTGTGQLAVIPTTQGGTYYVLVYGDHLPESSTDFSIEAYLADFAVYDTSYGRGGTAGNLTIEINGAGFDRSVTAQINDGAGFQLNASEYYFVDGTKLYATFDLTKTAPGTYDVVVHNGDGAEITVDQALEVVEGGGGTNRPEINVPSLVRWGREFQFTVTWGNDGLNDALAPLLTVGGSQAFGFSPGDDQSAGTGYTFLGTNTHGGPPGILRPGQRETMTFFSVADPNLGDFQFYVDREYKDLEAPYDWEALQSELDFGEDSDDELQRLVRQLETQTGSTNGDYLTMLARNSSLIPSVLGDSRDVSALVQLEVTRARAAIGTSVAGYLRVQEPYATLGGINVALRGINRDLFESTVTLNDGAFFFQDVVAGNYFLEAFGVIPLEPDWEAISVAAGQHIAGLTLEVASGNDVYGTVTDSITGVGIAGATVIAYLGDSRIGATDTNLQGHYRLSGIPSGKVTFVVNAPGAARTWVREVDINNSVSPVNIVMVAESTIGGTLQGCGTSETLYAIAQRADTNPQSSFVAQIDDGAFLFEGLSEGVYNVMISAEGCAPATLYDLPVDGFVNTNLGVIGLKSASYIEGSILLDGVALKFSEVRVGAFLDDIVVASSEVTPEGHYRIADIIAGTYVLKIVGPTGKSIASEATVSVAAGESATNVDISVVTGATLDGVVYDALSNSNLAYTLVNLIDSGGNIVSTSTDSNGHYTFSGLNFGKYYVTLPFGGVDTRSEVAISEIDGATLTIDLEVAGTGSVEGDVRYGDGSRATSGTVVLYADGFPAANAPIDDQGHYILRLIRAGVFDLHAVVPGAVFPIVKDVRVELGESGTQDLSGGSESARIRLDGPEEVDYERAIIEVTNDNGGVVRLERDLQTNETIVDGLQPGVYSVHVTVDGTYSGIGSLNVVAGELATCTIVLARGYHLAGNVTGMAGLLVKSAGIQVRSQDSGTIRETTTRADGSYSISPLEPGIYTLSINATGYSRIVRQDVIVTEDLTIDVRLDVASVYASGRIASLNGTPPVESVIVATDSEGLVLGTASSNQEGRFRVEVEGGTLTTFTIYTPGFVPATVADTVITVAGFDLGTVIIEPIILSGAGAEVVAAASTIAVGSPTTLSDATTLVDAANVSVEASGLLTWFNSIYKYLYPPKSDEHTEKPDPPSGQCHTGLCQGKWKDLSLKVDFQDASYDKLEATGQIIIGAGGEWAAREVAALSAIALAVGNLAGTLEGIALVQSSLYGYAAFLGGSTHAALVSSLATSVLTAVASAAIDYSANYTGIAAANTPETILEQSQRAAGSAATHAGNIAQLKGDLERAVYQGSLSNGGPNSVPWTAFWQKANILFNLINIVQSIYSAYQEYTTNMANLAAEIIREIQEFERQTEEYNTNAHLARVYLFRYLGCLKQPCDPCDGPNPPADCDPCKGPNPPDSCGGGGGGGSHDPNDKLGPEGYDVFGFIKPNTVLAYTVRFENDAKATASAVLVTITDQLDSDDDWSTFQLGNMQFDDHVIEVPPGLTYFETRIDLRPEGNNLFVDIVGEFNSDTGLAQWSFTGIDPATGELTDDPLAGFLPPNNPDVHDGEGYVQYSVYPKIDLETATQITNVATIVFDWNEPIDTPLVTNTIDAGLPTSAVDLLPNQVAEKVFQVSWAGTDDSDGSGVRSYDIFVSVDGGPYQRWLSETTATSATFAGEFARSYAFYSVAHDNVGHIELTPLTPDAQTVTPAGTASVGDRVWLDIDADGLQDAGEHGIANITVELFQSDGTAIGSDMTDAAGYYRFDDLNTTLQYYLVFTSPAGYRFSPQNQSLDNSRDSDVDPETGQTDSFSVTPGEHVGWDAGLYEPGEIRGTLWYDANQDGNQDNIEPVLPGWTVFIDLNENGFLDEGEPSVVADESGAYQFAGLDPGAYSLREIMPSTWDQVYPGAIGASDEPQSRWALKFNDAVFLQAEGIDIQALANSVPVLVDWNNDGLKDLLVGETIGSYGKVRLYLNEGSAAQPEFGEVVYLQVDGADLAVPAAGSLGVFPRVVDWNNDARKDLLLGLNDGRVQVLLNVNTDEMPEFQTSFYVEAGPLGSKSQIDVGSQATVEMADWNADGRLDLIVGASDGQVRVFLNEGSPESPDYRNPWIVQDATGNLSTPGGAASVAVADLDGDGRLDLVLGNSVGSLYLYRNVGSSEVPRFEAGQTLKVDGHEIAVGTTSSRPWIDDLDGDGVTDLIVGGADGRIRVYMRDSGADSASIYTTTSSPVDIFTPSLTDSLPLDAGAAGLIGLKEFRSDARFAEIDGRGLAVVVIDTGLDLDHPFFGGDQNGDGVSDRIVFQYDFADADGDASDVVGHGSNVTSIIASSDLLHQGVAPGVDIIHLKIFSNDGYGQFADAERALQWVIQNADAYHVAAVNLSFGDLGNWDEASGRFGIGDELAALAAMDVIVVASAGNSYATFGGSQGVAYPAADPNTIAVGAVWDGDYGGPWNFGNYGTDFTTTTDGIAVFSQRDGQLLDTFAPGAAILGADARGGTTTMTGTSQAAPFVTGVAVLAQQIAMETLGRPLTQFEFRTLLHSTGQTIIDGDDENDSVPNTGLSFSRLDVLALAGAIGQLDAANPIREADPAVSDSSGDAGTFARTLAIPFAHRVQVVSGDVRTGVDFGNRLQDMPPDVDDQQYNVDENLTAGAEIGTVFATDPNFGDMLEFTILSCGDTCPVAILPSTGKLTVADGSQFDFEIISHLDFTVAIKDSTGLTSEAAITINVNDVNDPPFAIYLSGNVVKERVAGAAIGTLSAGDQDTGQTHTFSLVDDASLFEIVGDTLRLKADAYLDTSDGAAVDVNVMVHDSGTPAGTRLQTLTVSLLENSKPWQNPVQPLDVNGDGRVEPLDVLNIINELFQRVVIGSSGLLPRSRAAEGVGFYFDSNGDGYCAPLDALIVINFLNARAFGDGENTSVVSAVLGANARNQQESDCLPTSRILEGDQTPRTVDRYFAGVVGIEAETIAQTRPAGASSMTPAWNDDLENILDGIAADVTLGAGLPAGLIDGC
ncbi:MAG: carboxypeptidase regulatory-like domain-containing protein [Planctomycetales bacterium]|nr:carboxypeptidase regulatory-like domain-containing protein [Planctomycetales bacterium]